MARNKKLFNQVADYIEMEEDHYDQQIWGDGEVIVANRKPQLSCGTTCCIAGTTAILAGAIPYFSEIFRDDKGNMHYASHDWEQVVLLEKEDKKTTEIEWRKYTNFKQYTSEFSCDALGLESSESDVLFDGYWEPKFPLSVPEALRLLGDGASIQEVTYNNDRVYE